MLCCFSLFKGLAVLVFSVQIVKSVFKWIYENFVGPAVFGNSINFKNFGQWASKLKFAVFKFECNLEGTNRFPRIYDEKFS